jgi:hypothetical protein
MHHRPTYAYVEALGPFDGHHRPSAWAVMSGYVCRPLKSFMPHERDRAHAYANELNLQRERELEAASSA